MSIWAPEFVVDDATARRLIRSQFPGLRADKCELLGEGWDMTVYLVDGAHVFRFPRRDVVVPGLLRELQVLPRIAPALPLRIPEPRFAGRPDDGYPWPFYGAPLIPGKEVGQVRLTQPERDALAPALAAFLKALHGLAVDVELPVDPMGRANPAVRAPQARKVLERLEAAGVWRAPASARKWLREGERLGPSERLVLAHGDLHLRHVLVDAGRASGVIDWIDVCHAPPAADLALYWCLFSPAGRREFIRTYGDVSGDDLLRARVLALNLCAILADYARASGMNWLEREAVGGLERTVS
jgi:aminoglycoside phosphotransferase (APT) family kinase protein